MLEFAQWTAPNLLKLPSQIAVQFHSDDRFLVWVSHDTLHLKRITPPAVTDKVAHAPDDHPLSLEEINEMVHQVRRERKGN